MKRLFSAAAAALLATTIGATFAPATASAAAPASVVTDLNVRAGPGTQYPAVTVFPRGSRVTVIGCTRGTAWCDVSGRGVRGWVSAHYLEFRHRGDRLIGPAYGTSAGLPIISFQIGSYWDNHYRGRSWYRDRSRYDRHNDHIAPRSEYRRGREDWEEDRAARRAERRAERWDERRERWRDYR